MEGVPPEVEALLWGVISALALPLGALVSFAKKKPSLRVRAGLMAFGAGALLFALAIELFGETVCEHKQDEDYIIIVAVMAGAAILGGLAFQGIEHLINSKGGFFRSLSTKFSFIQARKEKAWEKYRIRLEKLTYLGNLEQDEVKMLVKYLKRKLITKKGTVLFKYIMKDTPLFFLRKGAVELIEFDADQVEIGRRVVKERGWIGETDHVAVADPIRMTAVATKPCYLITIERKYIALVLAKKIQTEIEKDEESSSSSSSSSSHSNESSSEDSSASSSHSSDKKSKRSKLVQSLVDILGDGEDMIREANEQAEEIPMSSMSMITDQIVDGQNGDKNQSQNHNNSESDNLDEELSKSSSRSGSRRSLRAEDDPAIDTPEIAEENVKEELKEVQKNHNVARAIWLGLLIDAVPESLVIGSLVTSTTGISVTFIAGVFLANFPEALSSSILMQEQQRLSKARIMLMWFTITAVTGIGALIGSLIFRGELTYAAFLVTKGIEGLAGGAMLVVIAKTMLPEAFEMGSQVSGLATLFGFLAALLVSAGEAGANTEH